MTIKDEALNVIINELVLVDGEYILLENLKNIDLMVSEENIKTVKEKVLIFLDKLNTLPEDEVDVLLKSDFQDEVYDTL